MAWLFQGSEPELLALSDREFISVWSALFGGPPAAIINRSDMIDLMRTAFGPDRDRLAEATANRTGPDGQIREAPGPRP
jgi:hypothetical protein